MSIHFLCFSDLFSAGARAESGRGHGGCPEGIPGSCQILDQRRVLRGAGVCVGGCTDRPVPIRADS